MLPGDVASNSLPVIFMTIEHPVHIRTWKNVQNDAARNGIVVNFTTLIGKWRSNISDEDVEHLLQRTPSFSMQSGNGERDVDGTVEPATIFTTSINTNATGHVNTAQNAILLRRTIKLENIDQPTEFHFKDNRTTSNQAAERIIMDQRQKNAIGLEWKIKFDKQAGCFTIYDTIVLHNFGSNFDCADSRLSKHAEHEICGDLSVTYRENNLANELTLNLERTLTVMLPNRRMDAKWYTMGSIDNKSEFPRNMASNEEFMLRRPRFRFYPPNLKRLVKSRSTPSVLKRPQSSSSKSAKEASSKTGRLSLGDEPINQQQDPLQEKRAKQRVSFPSTKPSAVIAVPPSPTPSRAVHGNDNDDEPTTSAYRREEATTPPVDDPIVETRTADEGSGGDANGGSSSQILDQTSQADNDDIDGPMASSVSISSSSGTRPSWHGLVKVTQQAEQIYQDTGISPLIIAGQKRTLLSDATPEEDAVSAPMTPTTSANGD